MHIYVSKKYLTYQNNKVKCAIGKRGITSNKKEGDKKTPKGVFKLGNLYFRKDRIKKPKTSLKCIEIKKNMGWCDDIRFPKKYNKLIKIEKKINEIAQILLPILMIKKKFYIGQIGQSLDGKIALLNGNSHYINDKNSISYLHSLRSVCDAVIVGVNTIKKDNPLLTTRAIKGSNPQRIIIDPSLKLTNNYQIFKDGFSNIIAIDLPSKGLSSSGADLFNPDLFCFLFFASSIIALSSTEEQSEIFIKFFI